MNSLGPDGLFRSGTPESPDGTPIISEAEAKSQALAFVRTFASHLHEGWEKQRGAPLALSTLEIRPHAYFARSPYGAVPSQGFHPAVKRLYGPYYVVTLSSLGRPALLIAVSAYNTDVTIDQKGILHFPVNSGDDFVPYAIPVRHAPDADLPTPEEAATIASKATGSRVSAAPQLVLRGRPYTPLAALWEVSLEHAVSATLPGGGSKTVQTIYVSSASNRGLELPLSNTAATEKTRFSRLSVPGQSAGEATLTIPVREGRALRFNSVNLRRGE